MLKPLLLIGVGNPFRRDDGLGPAVLAALKPTAPEGVIFSAQSGEGSTLMAAWQGYDQVLLVDAVCSGAPAGTLHVLDAMQGPIPSRFFHYSTHAFSVAEAIEMARALGELPRQLTLLGIEGADFGAGQGFSPAVQAAWPELLRQIQSQIAQGDQRDA
ncbi:MAG: hydrogenase maturation protease [Candidatus Sericytochromatia bacterium]